MCLQTGMYRLDGPVVINQASSVTVRGQGLRTLLVCTEGAFRVTGSAYVTLEDFSVLAPGLPSAILLKTTAAVTVQRLTIVTVGNADQGGTAVTLGGVALRTAIRDNAFLVGTAVTGGFDDTPLLTAELTVSDNLMVCRERGWTSRVPWLTCWATARPATRCCAAAGSASGLPGRSRQATAATCGRTSSSSQEWVSRLGRRASRWLTTTSLVPR